MWGDHGEYVSRRTVLRKTAFTSATAAGLTAVPTTASAATETLDGFNNETSGDHDQAAIIGSDGDTACTEAELAISSALDADSTPYDDGPAPVHCNWSAQTSGPALTTVIDNLEMTVEINNKLDGWNFSNVSKAKREAPTTSGFEPSFGVSVSLFVYSFGLSFSSSGSANSIPFQDESVTHDFGKVCDTSNGLEENTGWIRVQLTNPQHSDPSGSCELTVSVSCDVTFFSSGPGPCGLAANGKSDSMSASETFEVDFV